METKVEVDYVSIDKEFVELVNKHKFFRITTRFIKRNKKEDGGNKIVFNLFPTHEEEIGFWFELKPKDAEFLAISLLHQLRLK